MATPVVNDAVGIPEINWFVAIVKPKTEKTVVNRLTDAGHEAYVPLQKEMHLWKNGRKTQIDRILIPGMVFIKTTETKRKEIVSLPYILRFMVDSASAASSSGHRPVAKIPQDQIDTLRFMVGNSSSPIAFQSQAYQKGERVKVIRGSLKGLEGVVGQTDSKNSELVINIDFIGSARLLIESINVERISQ